MNLQTILNQENNQRSLAEEQHRAVVTGPDTVVSRPVKLPEPGILQALREKETADILARDRVQQGTEPEVFLDTPASIFHELHGETMLRNVLDLPKDSAQTEFLNNYILQKMRIGKLQDTQENFDKVLGNLLAKNGLSRSQQKSWIVNKLYLYLNGGTDDEDDLVLSIIKGRRKNGIW